MIDDEAVNDFLAHHGVKGMRWGTRRARSPSGKAAKKPKTAAEKRIRNNKILGAAMIVAGGALLAKLIVEQHATMKVRSAANIYNPSKNIKLAQQINDVISMNSGVRMSQVVLQRG